MVSQFFDINVSHTVGLTDSTSRRIGTFSGKFLNIYLVSKSIGQHFLYLL